MEEGDVKHNSKVLNLVSGGNDITVRNTESRLGGNCLWVKDQKLVLDIQDDKAATAALGIRDLEMGQLRKYILEKAKIE